MAGYCACNFRLFRLGVGVVWCVGGVLLDITCSVIVYCLLVACGRRRLVCRDCRVDVLDPVVAVAQVAALRRLVAGKAHVRSLIGVVGVRRLLWPEVFVNPDGTHVALVGDVQVSFTPAPLSDEDRSVEAARRVERRRRSLGAGA